VRHNPSSNQLKIKEGAKKRGHRLAPSQVLPGARSLEPVARRHRLAVKQAKMATARRNKTGQPWFMVDEHRTAKQRKKKNNGSPITANTRF